MRNSLKAGILLVTLVSFSSSQSNAQEFESETNLDFEVIEEIDTTDVPFQPQGCPISLPIEIELPQIEPSDLPLVLEALNFDGSHTAPVCAYFAESRRTGRPQQIEQYIPTEPIADSEVDPDQLGWTLISMDGEPPTEEQFNDYEHRGGKLFPYREYIDLLDFSELRVVERKPEKLILQTIPTEQFLEDQDAPYLLDRVTMDVVIDIPRRRLDYIRTSLDKPFRPNAFVRIKDFDQRLDFEFIPEIGEVALTHMTMKADIKLVVVNRKFELSAQLYDFSCPLVLQPDTCPELSADPTTTAASQ